MVEQWWARRAPFGEGGGPEGPCGVRVVGPKGLTVWGGNGPEGPCGGSDASADSPGVGFGGARDPSQDSWWWWGSGVP